MTTNQLMLDGFTVKRRKGKEVPVMLARRNGTCGFRCGHPIRIGDPITILTNGYWAHVHDVNDAELMKRAEKLEWIRETFIRQKEEQIVRAAEKANHHPEEALEETVEWQRAHLSPEERWHPDLVEVQS